MPEINDPMPTTIADNYREFSNILGHEKLDASAREFARRCFYAGACAMFTTVTVTIGDMSENGAVAAFEVIDAEVRSHLHALMAGDA